MSKKIWKQHPEYPNYAGSPDGKIKNNETGQILKPYPTDNRGYMTDSFLRFFTVISRINTIYTTLTTMLQITVLIICNVCYTLTIYNYTLRKDRTIADKVYRHRLL